MKYLVNKKTGLLHSALGIRNFSFDENIFDLIETEKIPNKVINIWNGSEFIEGATLEEIEELNKPIIPEIISVIPFLVQLELMGITENDIIEKINELHQAEIINNQEKIEALISIKRATKFERNHPFIALISASFNVSSKQLDQIFINGNKS